MFLSTKHITMLVVSFALFMDVLDANIINTAIPAMSRSLNVSPIDLKIALISYLLSIAIFVPTSGWVADRFGAKPIFIGALMLFTITSFFCGYATSLEMLIVARSIQGIGGAYMVSLGRLLIARAFPRNELVAAMNVVIMVVAVAIMLGPFVGGVITDRFSWPWIFWINIPVGIFLALIAIFGLKDTTPKNVRKFDKVGFILFGGSLAILLYALSEMSETNADIGTALWMIVAAFSMLLSYLFYAKKIPHPLIRLEFFQIRTFRVSVMGNLFSRLGFAAMPFLLPLMFQIVFGYSAELSGTMLVPIAFGIVTAKLVTLRTLRIVGYKKFLIVNAFCVAAVVWLFLLVNQNTSIYFIMLLTFLYGLVIACQFTAMNSLAFADVDDDGLSAITSITSTAQMLAQSLGVAIGAIFLRLFSKLSQDDAMLSLQTFHHTFVAMGVLTCFTALIFLMLRTRDGRKMLD